MHGHFGSEGSKLDRRIIWGTVWDSKLHGAVSGNEEAQEGDKWTRNNSEKLVYFKNTQNVERLSKLKYAISSGRPLDGSG